eukprot:350570-Chlamydomonas_euryale.AAC.1
MVPLLSESSLRNAKSTYACSMRAALGSGFWQRVLAMALGNGFWRRRLATALDKKLGSCVAWWLGNGVMDGLENGRRKSVGGCVFKSTWVREEQVWMCGRKGYKGNGKGRPGGL